MRNRALSIAIMTSVIAQIAAIVVTLLTIRYYGAFTLFGDEYTREQPLAALKIGMFAAIFAIMPALLVIVFNVALVRPVIIILRTHTQWVRRVPAFLQLNLPAFGWFIYSMIGFAFAWATVYAGLFGKTEQSLLLLLVTGALLVRSVVVGAFRVSVR